MVLGENCLLHQMSGWRLARICSGPGDQPTGGSCDVCSAMCTTDTTCPVGTVSVQQVNHQTIGSHVLDTSVVLYTADYLLAPIWHGYQTPKRSYLECKVCGGVHYSIL